MYTNVNMNKNSALYIKCDLSKWWLYTNVYKVVYKCLHNKIG